ncbi:MAG TPA: cellulase N-terminal Ig-like domain-containing protein [Polyangiaceae bacterium]
MTRAASAQDFEVRRTDDDSVALRGALSEEFVDTATATPVRLADFSELAEAGEYYVEVEGTAAA